MTAEFIQWERDTFTVPDLSFSLEPRFEEARWEPAVFVPSDLREHSLDSAVARLKRRARELIHCPAPTFTLVSTYSNEDDGPAIEIVTLIIEVSATREHRSWLLEELLDFLCEDDQASDESRSLTVSVR